MKKLLFLQAVIISSFGLFAQTYSGSNGAIVVDPNNANYGNLNSSLLFGSPTGEGIASKRGGGGNQYGLDFYTNHTNRLTITNQGRVGIGTIIPQKQLSLSGGMNVDQSNSNSVNLNNGLTFGSSSGEGIASNRIPGVNQYGLDLYAGGINRLLITNSGNVGIGIAAPTVKLHVGGAILATGNIVPSDIRYKKDILPITGALKTVMSLSAFTYLLKKEEFPEMGFDSKLQYGLLAQNVENVVPDIVYTSPNGYKALDYTRLIPFLIEGMKEQQQAIEKQQQQIDELKKIIDSLLKK
jgi:endosialidase-like protein